MGRTEFSAWLLSVHLSIGWIDENVYVLPQTGRQVTSINTDAGGCDELGRQSLPGSSLRRLKPRVSVHRDHGVFSSRYLLQDWTNASLLISYHSRGICFSSSRVVAPRFLLPLLMAGSLPSSGMLYKILSFTNVSVIWFIFSVVTKSFEGVCGFTPDGDPRGGMQWAPQPRARLQKVWAGDLVSLSTTPVPFLGASQFCRQDVCKFAFPDAAWMWKSFTKLGASFQKKPFVSERNSSTLEVPWQVTKLPRKPSLLRLYPE